MIMVIGPHKRKTDAMAAAKAERATERASRSGRPALAETADLPDLEAEAMSQAADSAPEADSAPARPAAASPAAASPAPASPAPASPAPARTAPASSPAPASPAAPASPRPAAPRPQARPGAASPAAPKPSAPRSAASPAPRPGRALVGYRDAPALGPAEHRGRGQDDQRVVRDDREARPGSPGDRRPGAVAAHGSRGQDQAVPERAASRRRRIGELTSRAFQPR